MISKTPFGSTLYGSFVLEPLLPAEQRASKLKFTLVVAQCHCFCVLFGADLPPGSLPLSSYLGLSYLEKFGNMSGCRS